MYDVSCRYFRELIFAKVHDNLACLPSGAPPPGTFVYSAPVAQHAGKSAHFRVCSGRFFPHKHILARIVTFGLIGVSISREECQVPVISCLFHSREDIWAKMFASTKQVARSLLVCYSFVN